MSNDCPYPGVTGPACFPGILDTDQTCFRYVDKTTTGNEQYLFSNYYREQIAQYGTRITYYVNAYNVLSADNFYGEDPTQSYMPGVDVNVIVELSENANVLTKFGFQADDEITIRMHISAFQDAFYDLGIDYVSPTQEENPPIPDNLNTEDCLNIRTEMANVWETQYQQTQPKSGDVFALTEYGEGRVNPRGAKWFEVTEILDEDISYANQLGGHYTWIIKGKRYEYSYEPGLSAEKGDSQVYDNAYSGILSGGSQPVSEPKKYNEEWAEPGVTKELKSINDISVTQVFDQPARNNTSVYGQY